jgi:hypothetical protein
MNPPPLLHCHGDDLVCLVDPAPGKGEISLSSIAGALPLLQTSSVKESDLRPGVMSLEEDELKRSHSGRGFPGQVCGGRQ